jgi:hypothetical protein
LHRSRLPLERGQRRAPVRDRPGHVRVDQVAQRLQLVHLPEPAPRVVEELVPLGQVLALDEDTAAGHQLARGLIADRPLQAEQLRSAIRRPERWRRASQVLRRARRRVAPVLATVFAVLGLSSAHGGHVMRFEPI